MHGSALLQTIRSLPSEASAAVFLRHAQRHPIVDASDPTLAELTPEGSADAEAFGAKISGFGCVRVFHSPVKRCRQTAECIARGVATTGGPVEIVGAEDALGIDYILDLPEAGRLTVLHGERFVRMWFSGNIPSTVIQRAERIAARKLTHLVARLQEPCALGRRLDLHVSHDWNIIVLRELMLGVRHEEAGWLDFLDGVAFLAKPGTLRAIYREHSVTKPLPWTFSSGSKSASDGGVETAKTAPGRDRVTASPSAVDPSAQRRGPSI